MPRRRRRDGSAWQCGKSQYRCQLYSRGHVTDGTAIAVSRRSRLARPPLRCDRSGPRSHAKRRPQCSHALSAQRRDASGAATPAIRLKRHRRPRPGREGAGCPRALGPRAGHKLGGGGACTRGQALLVGQPRRARERRPVGGRARVSSELYARRLRPVPLGEGGAVRA